MSDLEDGVMQRLTARIAFTYARLVTVCAALPIPVALPKGQVSHRETVPAVRRITELITETLLPDEQRGQLVTAATMWLIAVDLHILLTDEDGEGFIESRAVGALGVLIMAMGDLDALGRWQALNPS
ncbi:hypothetical protein [Streptomyces sp. SID3212]|uniref:hypothetical protein n=1 Tax=Streptomyces sp. SID3212 TaxID=2690259 RepID=UPI00136EA98B|nr:hypothetical protein [Streptomyces sp. SID3212]MYV56527.1 hypothetical protein [Streptomyces sp. SID3212]